MYPCFPWCSATFSMRWCITGSDLLGKNAAEEMKVDTYDE